MVLITKENLKTLNYLMFFTWGVTEETMTPKSPAHWLAVNLESDTPTLTFPPKAMAAANGSQDLATSIPYFMNDSDALVATPQIFFFKWLLGSIIFFRCFPTQF